MTNELAKKNETELATQGKTGRGFEEPSSQEDLIIPRAKLLQALSPEVKEDGMEQGLVINSLTKEVLPEEFVPIFKFTNWIRFNPRQKGARGFDGNCEPGAIIYRTIDPHDPRLKEDGVWGENGEAPIATKFMNFFCYFPGVPMPVVVGFSKTSFRTGKELNSLAQFRGGDMFKYKYVLKSAEEHKNGNDYYVFKVKANGEASKEEFAVAEQWYNQFSRRTEEIKVHAEEDQEDWQE